ncbi:MAG: cytochrome d ubiquinol oxidase subunit II [Acidobacteria bacterium]|nr:cytochrome d ubiquinol oxidase subunit II [Acidobacteriota bacterium]
MLETLWFFLLGILFMAFVVMDGFDWGVGIVQPFLCRNAHDRQAAQATIGPFWDGNEVWLIAAGGTLYFAFPKLYAISFSGFYLPLMLLLWILILRALALELGHQWEQPLWQRFWHFVFASSSSLIALVFGVALGNLIRGVPLDTTGYFLLPFWTNFSPRSSELGVFDGFTLVLGVYAVLLCAGHGLAWLELKAEPELAHKAGQLLTRIWAIVLVCDGLVAGFTYWIQPRFFGANQWLSVLLGLGALTAWVVMRWLPRQRFLLSCLHLVGLLLACFCAMLPFGLLEAGSASGIRLQDLAAPSGQLKLALFWWVPALGLVCGYFVFVHKKFWGRILSH